MKTFELMDHTADIGIIAYGSDIKQVFSHAAEGLFSLIVDLDSIGEKATRPVEVSAEDLEMLLAVWLNELIYIVDSEQLIFKRFDIISVTNTYLMANCFGEKIDPERHELKKSVKAATYHELKVERKDGYRAQVILDV